MSPAMSKTLHSSDDTPSTESSAAAAAPVVLDLPGGTLNDVAPTPGATAEAKKPAPNAIVTRAQCDAARETGTWKHDNASTALWLNSTVATKGLSAEALAETLAVYGVEVR